LHAPQYSNQQEALDVSDQVKIVMLRVLPGRSLHIAKQTAGLMPTNSYDSHSSSNFQEW
jgi:hypothetical protein